VQIDSRKFGMHDVPFEKSDTVWNLTKRQGFHFLSLIAIVVFMLIGFSPTGAVFWAIIAAFAVSFLNRDAALIPYDFFTGRGPRWKLFLGSGLMKALEGGSIGVLNVAATCAAAGIIVGVVTLTGVGLNLSSTVLSVSQGNLLLALILIMIASLIMGMGTPTTVAYIIVATLGVPVLEKMGVAALPSHMFVFYFGVISMITPPVAVAAFAAADIAEDSMWRVGWTATKLALVAFLIPFMFVLDPGLLFQGPWLNILGVTVSATIGVVGLAAGLVGWFFHPVGWAARVYLFVAALLLIVPGVRTDLIGLTMLIAAAAVALARRRAAASATTGKPGE